MFDTDKFPLFTQTHKIHHYKSYDKSVMAHMTFYTLRKKFQLIKPQLRFGLVNETFVFASSGIIRHIEH